MMEGGNSAPLSSPTTPVTLNSKTRIMDDNLVQEVSHSQSTDSELTIETVNDRDASENRETFGDSEFSGDGETFSGLESSSCMAHCPVCGDDPSKASPQLLACLHSVCLNCTRGKEIITCSRCRHDTRVAFLVADFVYHKTENPDRIGGQDEHLVALLFAGNTLGDLQEVRDNTRSLVEETYQSYRAVLEQYKNAALIDLEERHNEMELAIIEKLEHYDITESGLELAMTNTEQLVSNWSVAEQQQLEVKVVYRINILLEQLDSKLAGLQTSLQWESDKAAFSAAVRENCGKFSLPLVIPSTGVTIISPSLVVRDFADSSQTALVQALLTPVPTLGQVTMTPTLGRLSLGPLFPASPSLSLPLCSPQSLPRLDHGPIGSSVSSPAHKYSLPPRSHLDLSHPDLSLSSPRHSLGLTQHTPIPHNTNVEYNLALLANISMKRSTSSPISINPSFTLTDLISNVEDDSVLPLTPSWDPSLHPPHHPHQYQALYNLAAQAKLDEYNKCSGRSCNNSWPTPDPTLLLPDLKRDHNSILTRSLSNLGSDTSPGNHSIVDTSNHSLSPELEPGNILTQLILRHGINMSGLMTQPGSAQPILLNSMRILCKIGDLGPGNGQFNSPHGFCGMWRMLDSTLERVEQGSDIAMATILVLDEKIGQVDGVMDRDSDNDDDETSEKDLEGLPPSKKPCLASDAFADAVDHDNLDQGDTSGHSSDDFQVATADSTFEHSSEDFQIANDDDNLVQSEDSGDFQIANNAQSFDDKDISDDSDILTSESNENFSVTKESKPVTDVESAGSLTGPQKDFTVFDFDSGSSDSDPSDDDFKIADYLEMDDTVEVEISKVKCCLWACNCNLLSEELKTQLQILTYQNKKIDIKNELLSHLQSQHKMGLATSGFWFGGRFFCAKYFSKVSGISTYILTQVLEDHEAGRLRYEHGNNSSVQFSLSSVGFIN